MLGAIQTKGDNWVEVKEKKILKSYTQVSGRRTEPDKGVGRLRWRTKEGDDHEMPAHKG